MSYSVRGKIELEVNFVPYGELEHVMANKSSKIKSKSLVDVVIIMGGTNDVEVQSPYRWILHQAFQTLPQSGRLHSLHAYSRSLT